MDAIPHARFEEHKKFMPNTVVAQRSANVPALSAAELREILADAARLPCTVDGANGGTRFVLGRDDIAVVLGLGGDGETDSAQVEFSLSAELPSVTAVFKAFRALGWTFQD
jgi:hypothetical protein